MTSKKTSGLKQLGVWQNRLYPVAFLIVAIGSWLKERFFRAWLPMHKRADFNFDPAIHGLEAVIAPMRILVVDDSELHQEVSLHLLQKQGFIADFAFSGAEAVEACRKNQYDLVLMDIYMPGIDGLQATEEIRREARHVRIIAVTGQLPVDTQRLTACGMDGILTKPLISSDLQRELRISSALRAA